MDKEAVVHLQSGISLSHKEEWNDAICSNKDGPRDYHYWSKWSKWGAERQISYDIIYRMESKKNDTDELIYKTERDSQT